MAGRERPPGWVPFFFCGAGAPPRAPRPVPPRPPDRTPPASMQIVINPLVNWIWFGFGILALGTGITLLPERTYSFALAKMPAEGVATTVALLLALVLSGTTASAQHVGSGLQAPIVP